MNSFTRPRASPVGAVTTAAAVAALFTTVGVFHTFVRLAVLDEAYQLSRVEAEQRSLVRENEQLRVELATLHSPARIEPLAKKLGMVRPDPGQVRRIGAGGNLPHPERDRVRARTASMARARPPPAPPSSGDSRGDE
jgi:cell division protein FtsL